MRMHRFLLFCKVSFFLFLFSYVAWAADNKKLSYIYNENSVNFVSDNQVNAIEFPVPIAQVNSPPGQFDKNNRSISYVNSNKTMLFYLSSGASEVQFMVTMRNGHVLSLHFKGEKSQGRIVRIPDTLCGGIIEKARNNSYDVKVKKLMRSVLLDMDMDNKWVKTKELLGHRDKNFNIKKYIEWDSFLYKIKEWEFCSISRNVLFVDYKKFHDTNKVLATTLSNDKLLPNECTRLVILYDKGSNRAI